MALTDKDILITPNDGSSTADPKTEFTGANSSASDTITLETQFDGSITTLSYEGSAGQLFSISNDLSGTLFAVNDSSGVPSLEIDNNGEIRLSEFDGNVIVGNTNSTPLSSLFEGRLIVKGSGDQDPIMSVTDSTSTGSAAGVFHQSSTSPSFPAFVVNSAANSSSTSLISAYTNVNNTTGVSGTEVFKVTGQGNLTVTGTLNSNTVNTGQGSTEVHLMNQNVRTTDSPTFDELTVTDFVKASGNNLKFSAGGTHVLNIDLNNHVYPQTHNVTDVGFSSSLAFKDAFFSGVGNFGTINTGQGATEVHLMNQNLRTTDSPTFATLNVTGDLNITGDINSYNVTDLDVTDKTITVGAGQTEANSGGSGLIVDGSGASLLWDESDNYWAMNKSLAFDDTVTTTNQALGIKWTGFDKEGTGDFTDNASIVHTTNTGGISGSVLLLTSQNDSGDGIAFVTNGSSNLKHNSNTIWTAGNDGSGSGLDADTLDGQHASAFLTSFTETNAFLGDGGSANTHPGTGRVIYSGQVSAGSNVLGMPTTNNANAFLNLNKHSGEYNSQLGFSSNGNIYYRNFNNTAINSTATWRTIWDSGNDGSGSGLDADTLDGMQPNSSNVGSTIVARNSSGDFTARYIFATHFNQSTSNSENPTIGAFWTNSTADNYNRKSTPAHVISQLGLYTQSNDGSGSGLDADLVDGLQASQFLRSDTTDIMAASVGTNEFLKFQNNSSGGHIQLGFQQNDTDGLHHRLYIKTYKGSASASGNVDLIVRGSGGSTTSDVLKLYSGNSASWRNNTIWDAGNDGSGSGLDADLLDGQHGSYYLNYSNLTNTPTIPTNNNQLTNGAGYTTYTANQSLNTSNSPTFNQVLTTNNGNGTNIKIGDDAWFGDTNVANTIQITGVQNGTQGYLVFGSSDNTQLGRSGTGNLTYGGNTIWHAGTDGSGSGLDADLFDGTQKSDLDHAEGFKTWSGINASSTQAKRYHIARLYGCPAHWDGNWQNIEFHVTAESYESGTLKFRMQGDYGGAGSQANMIKLYLTEAHGPMIGRFRFILGSPVDAGWDHSGQDTYYVDLFAESAYYSQWKINAKTYGHGYQTSNPSSGGATTVFYSSPTASNVSDFNISHNDTYIRGSKIWNALNDGSGSGLDADTVDSLQASQFLRSDAEDSGVGINLNGSTLNQANDATFYVTAGNNNDWGIKIGANSGKTEYGQVIEMPASFNYAFRVLKNGSEHFNINSTGATIGGNYVWHAGNDGSGSGLDADTLDGINSGSFLRSDATDSASGTLSLNGRVNIGNSITRPSALNSDSVAQARIGGSDVYLYVASLNSTGGYKVAVQAARASDFASFTLNLQSNGGALQRAGNTVWDAGNDGSGSGLDSDLLDGQHGSHYLNYNNFTNTPTIPTNNNQLTNGAGYITGVTNISGYSGQLLREDNRTISPSELTSGRLKFGFTSWGNNNSSPYADFLHMRSYTDSSGGSDNLVMFKKSGIGMRIWQQTYGSSTAYSSYADVWTTGNDGSGSGLDADLLDGLQASQYLRSDANDTFGSTSANQKIRFNCNSGQYIASGGSETRFPIEIFSPTANGGDAAISFHVSGDYAGYFGLASDWNDLAWGGWSVGSSTKYRIWHSGNDGSGSGLDADTLDGQGGTYYNQSAYTSTGNAAGSYLGGHYSSGGSEKPNSNTFGSGKFKVAMLSSSNLGFGGSWNDVFWNSSYNGSDVKRSTALVSSKYDNTSLWIVKQNYDSTSWGTGYLFWNAGNDGSGSGLDADTLDGVQLDKFLQDNASEGDFRNQTSGSIANVYLGHTPTSNTGSAYIITQKQTNTGQPGSILFYISPAATTNTSTSTHLMHKFEADGDAHHDGDVIAYSTTTGSDRKLKENIRDLEGSLDKTLKLRGVKFDWKDERKANDQLGFIAQEVEEVLPEVVKEVKTLTKEDETHLTVNYPAVVPLLVEAIKEQQSIINRLEERLSDLENKLK